MQVPLEISYRDVEKTDELENLIREKAAKLDQVCDRLTSCRVALERPQRSQTSGNPYRVRIDMRVPPGHELVATNDVHGGDMHHPLEKVVRDTFETAKRQLRALMEKQRGGVKTHPAQETGAVIARLFAEQGYGFLRTPEGEEIYFHRNSVLNGGFEKLRVGTGVRYSSEPGEKGEQATTVQAVDQPSAG